MELIERNFEAYFQHWEIGLPPRDLAQRRRGRIIQAGWTIWYLFGEDRRGEYLDFYACHRMTNDRHVRLYADGGPNESLPTFQEMRRVSDDPAENRRLEQQQREHNLAVKALLEGKGFGLQGDEPLAVQINRYLYTENPDDER